MLNACPDHATIINLYFADLEKIATLHPERPSSTRYTCREWQPEYRRRGANLVKTSTCSRLGFAGGECCSSRVVSIPRLTFCRKTGLTVPDSGIRDEHGLEPMDGLFSSPNKAPKSSAKRKSMAKTANATLSGEEDMEMGESTFLGPC